jgi:hypothetical protein
MNNKNFDLFNEGNGMQQAFKPPSNIIIIIGLLNKAAIITKHFSFLASL